MARWMVFLGTLVVWLAVMRLVYVSYGMHEVHETVTGDRKALDNLFDESVELQTDWELFVRPSELNDSTALPFAGMGMPANTGTAQPKSAPHEAWNGFDERGLARVGKLGVGLRRKFTRAELKSELTIDVPESIRVPDALRKMRLSGWSSYSMEQGLDVCSGKLVIGDLLEASAMGARNGDDIFVTKAITLDKKTITLPSERLPVGAGTAPSVEILPFQRNKDVQEKVTWSIVSLDINSLDTGADAAKLKSVKVTCTGRGKIHYGGATIPVFEVSSEDGSSRAWYSADGNVLKQSFRFMNMFDIYVVRTLARPTRRVRPPSDPMNPGVEQNGGDQ